MTPWIVIGCIILFFVFLFTVHAFITIDLRDEMALTIRVLGIPIHILQKKQKKYKLSKYTLKKIRKRDAKAAKAAAKKEAKKAKKKAEKERKRAEQREADAKLTKAELKARKKAKKAKQPKLTDMIPLIARVAVLFFSRFFGKLRIKVARIHVKVGAGDAASAAVMFAVVNQSVQYLLAILGKISHVDGLKKADISIQPDFLSSGLAFDCNLTFRVSIGNVLGALRKAGFAFLRGYIRIKPDPDHPAPSIWPDLPDLPDFPDLPDLPELSDLPDSPL